MSISNPTGSISTYGYNPSNVIITGGTIDGTVIGGTTPAAGTFTTLTATGAFTSRGIDDNATAEVLQLADGTVTIQSSNSLVLANGDITLSEGMLAITDTANEVALNINSSASTAYALQMNASSITAGSVAYFYSGSSNATVRPLILIENDNASATGAVNLRLKQDAANAFEDFVGTAAANTTDPISTLTTSGATTHHIQVQINGTKAWIAVSTNNPS